MKKTPPVAYCAKLLRIAGKSELMEMLEDIPLSSHDYAFIKDIIDGLNNQELAEKHHKSASRISQWKRSVFEKIHTYELHHSEWLQSRSS